MRAISYLIFLWLTTILIVTQLSACEKHEQGIERTHNYELSTDVETLQSAAENGDKDAQFALAVKYHLGDGIQTDVKNAAFWYAKAADAGHFGAMNNLAALYYDGNGITQNFGKAIELYNKLADMGDIGGTTSLAGMYLDGKGVPQNYSEARRLYMLAAESGYAPAQTAIGVMYKFGWGVSRNNVEAYAWWVLAAANGDVVAVSNMNQLKPSLTSFDIERAQERAKKLVNENQRGSN